MLILLCQLENQQFKAIIVTIKALNIYKVELN